MNHSKPTPLLANSKGKTCPVCGQRSYSAAGIHPQCAVTKADAGRAEQIKADRKADVAKQASLQKQPPAWSRKKCPKCKSQVHIRQKQCHCGFAFPEN